MISKRMKRFALFGVVVLISGVATFAGVMIYQSKVGLQKEEDLKTDAIEGFPNHDNYTHFNFFDNFNQSELNLEEIIDTQKLATIQQKSFLLSNEKRLVENIIKNVILNSVYWKEYNSYVKNPSSYQIDSKYKFISEIAIYIFFGIYKNNQTFYYDSAEINI